MFNYFYHYQTLNERVMNAYNIKKYRTLILKYLVFYNGKLVVCVVADRPLENFSQYDYHTVLYALKLHLFEIHYKYVFNLFFKHNPHAHIAVL